MKEKRRTERLKEQSLKNRALDEDFDRAVALDDERDRRFGLGEFAPAYLTLCRACGALHDFDSCPACAERNR